jgi:predicted nucleic acid-binding protein
VILVDTSVLVAALIVDEPRHEECFAALSEAEPPRILSPFVVAEADYLIQKYGGLIGERRFLSEIGRGSYQIAAIYERDLQLAGEVISRYSDLKIGLTDASIVVLADRLDCRDVLTLDERHFRAFRTRKGPFRILPADL